MGKSKNGLPDRWLAYKSIGKEIRGVPIIACKVPLKEEILRNRLRQEQWFTPDNLVEMVPNVGCIVDLTATTRYYNPSVFTERGIHHAKIFCEGHVIPKLATVKTFFQVVDEFLHSIHSRGKVLMVHCTHGLNRTGYLVSRYMVERRGFQPNDAIQAFNLARGHDIERANYLQDLHQRSQCVCPNPLPLFQKRGPCRDFVHQAAAAAGYERSNSPIGYNLQDGLSESHNNKPPPLLDHHRHFPPPISHSSKEKPSSVTQPSESRPKGPRKGRHQSNKRQGTSASNNNSPVPPDVPEVPSVLMQPPPPLPATKKLPNVKWIVLDNPSAPLIDCNDRPTSRKRSKIKRQLVSVQQVPSTPPANAGPQKTKQNKSNPPSVAPKSDCQDRNQKRKSQQLDSSIEVLSTSSIEICYDSRKVEPSGQQNSKVHPVPGRSRNRAQQPERNGTSLSASRQELPPPPDLRPSGKKKRSRGRKGGAGRLNEASNPSAERT